MSDPPTPFQHHPVLIYRHRAEGVFVRWSLNHPLYCKVVHPRVFVPVVSTVMVVSGHDTHDAAVRAYDGQELVVVPGQTDG